MTVTVKIKGAKLLNNALKNLPQAVERKLAMKALRKGARVILKEAKARAPVRRGTLKKSLAIRTPPRQTKSAPRILVGATRDAPHAHLVEFGHAIVVADGAVGFVAAKPFLRPAFETRKADFLKIAGQELGRLIEAEAARLRGGAR